MLDRLEAEVNAEFGRVKGKVVLVLRVRALDGPAGEDGAIDLDPPAVGRVATARYAQTPQRDGFHTAYEVDLLSAHPALPGVARVTVMGPTYRAEGAGRRRDLVLAVPELARLYGDLSGLPESNATAAEAEATAIAEYRAIAGRVVLLHEVEGHDGDGDNVTIVCDPPAIGRVRRYEQKSDVDSCVVRWMDDDVIDPVYDVEILAPHPAFEGRRPSWIYGTSRYVGPKPRETGTRAFTLAPPDIAERYTDEPALHGHKLVPAPHVIMAEYVRMYLPDPAQRPEWEDEFDTAAFDATDAVLSLRLSEIMCLADGQADTDALVPAGAGFAPVGGPKGGGTEVRVVEAVKAYFAVEDLCDIDEEMLDEARRNRGLEAPPTFG